MLSCFCLLLSAAILAYILKYRVHIHVTVETAPKSRRSSARRVQHVHQSDRSPLPTVPDGDNAERNAQLRDIAAALRNQGANAATARAAAAKATAQTGDFGQALKLAIQYATKEAA